MAQTRLDRILEAKISWTLEQKDEVIAKYEAYISSITDSDKIAEMQAIFQEVKDNLF